MISKTLWVVGVLAIALVALCVLPGKMLGQARKATLKELTETSDAILAGKCEKKETFWNSSRTKIFTEVKIRTAESIKGNPGAEVVVTVPGGQVGGTVYEVSDMPSFLDGEEVLVFLWKHPSGKTLVTGALQGKLTIVEEKSTGKKVVRGARFLIDDELQQRPPGLKKAGIGKVEEQKVYFDDLKENIRKYVVK